MLCMYSPGDLSLFQLQFLGDNLVSLTHPGRVFKFNCLIILREGFFIVIYSQTADISTYPLGYCLKSRVLMDPAFLS